MMNTSLPTVASLRAPSSSPPYAYLRAAATNPRVDRRLGGKKHPIARRMSTHMQPKIETTVPNRKVCDVCPYAQTRSPLVTGSSGCDGSPVFPTVDSESL